MRHSSSFSQCESETGTDERSRFRVLFAYITAEDTVGVLNIIDETLEELETSHVNSRIDRTDDDDDYNLETASDNFPHLSPEEYGQLCTNAEGRSAMKRDGAPKAIADGEGKGRGEPEARRGIRNCVRSQGGTQINKRNDDEVEEVDAGIFGTSSKPSKWSLSYYLQSVASTREKRIVAVSAWILALVGLAISLVFVTKDFVDSNREMASTIRYEPADRLSLPAVWICSVTTQLPAFLEQPNKDFAGQPLMWLDFIGAGGQLDATYPETKTIPQFKTVNVNALGQTCQTARLMDPETFLEENHANPVCYSCFALSPTPSIIINRKANRSVSSCNLFGDSHERVSLRISQHSVLSNCRTSRLGLSKFSFVFIRSEIKSHAELLERQGILDFGGFNPANASDDQYLWPRYRMGYANSTIDFAVYDVVDLFCNTYLFSGSFYPSNSKDIKFKFNPIYLRWERAGSGPYYPPTFDKFYSENRVALQTYSGGSGIGEESGEYQSTITGQSLQIITNNSRTSGTDTLATLEPSTMANILLQKNMVRGRESYDAKTYRTKVRIGDVRGNNYVYQVDLSYSIFLTRMMSDQMTVSWPAFIADFFGLASMFLDVSVYTLIIAPIIMRSRKKALLARKEKRTAEAIVW